MTLLFFVGGIVLGIFIGVIVSNIRRRKLIVGDLLITDDEDGTYLSLELNCPISQFRGMNRIIVNIRNINSSYYGENQ